MKRINIETRTTLGLALLVALAIILGGSVVQMDQDGRVNTESGYVVNAGEHMQYSGLTSWFNFGDVRMAVVGALKDAYRSIKDAGKTYVNGGGRTDESTIKSILPGPIIPPPDSTRSIYDYKQFARDYRHKKL